MRKSGGASLRVVLVGPENPRNVGFAARAMLCFGAADLAVVGVPWTTPPAEARKTGVAALEILDRATVHPDLASALRGCDAAVAFSRRPTVLRQASFTLPEPPPRPLEGRVALVFGRESNGLTREESSLCPILARIPCREGLSLNLGQAVAIALFALAGPGAPAAKTGDAARAPVSLDRLLGLWDFLEPKLSPAPRFTRERLQRIRQMLFRLALDDEDFDLFFAVLNELALPAAVRARARR